MLVVEYSFPVDLRNTDGIKVAQAKSLVIKWHMAENPDAVIYGPHPYEPEGAFELTGDISNLEALLNKK